MFEDDDDVVFHWNASAVSSSLIDAGSVSSSGVRPNLMRSNAESLFVKIESLSHPLCNSVNSSRDISCMLGPVSEMRKPQEKRLSFIHNSIPPHDQFRRQPIRNSF